jgi:hypothetical protein
MIVPRASSAQANDNFANATPITALPFTDSVDISAATLEAGEPTGCYNGQQSIWYSFTPVADALMRLDPYGSSLYGNTLDVYQAVGPGFAGLSSVNCSGFTGQITFSVQAGMTYYIRAGSYFTGVTATLQTNLQEVPPPPNDNFAAATQISGLPFTDYQDTSAGTEEPGEPIAAGDPNFSQCSGPKNTTIWYVYTPSQSNSVTMTEYGAMGGVYTGTSLDQLTQVAAQCNVFGAITFVAEAGKTYYLQLNNFGYGGLYFNIEVTPPPTAQFEVDLYDINIFDTVQFHNTSVDPLNRGYKSAIVAYGDGSTESSFFYWAYHQYAADGDYNAALTVTTVDGRTATYSQIIQVKTHDVAITKFSTPTSATSGQTKAISVGVVSKRYAEPVDVILYRSGPAGYEFVAVQSVSVPARSTNRTTTVSFNYTFTKADATYGKVTFKAVAQMQARDALPTDNEAIASPTKMSR